MTAPTVPISSEPPAARGPGVVVRYGVAALAPFVALGLMHVAPAFQERATFLLFFGAVTLAAWYGLGPGLVATLVSVLLVDYAFIPPIGGFKPVHLDDVARLAGFVGIATFISVQSERSRRLRLEADARRAELEQVARQLQEQAVELEQQTEEAQVLAEELEETNAALGVANDRVEAERARVAQVLDGLDDAVVAYDGDWRLVHANRAGRDAMREGGIDASALKARPLWEALPQIRGTRIEEEMLRAVREQRVTEFEDVSPTLNRWRRIRVVPADGGAIVLSHDLTEERLAHARAEQSERRFRAMADGAPVLVWLAGPDGRREWFNRAWLEFTGHTLEQDLGDGWLAAVHPDDRAPFLDVYRASFAARREFEVEYRLRRHDGVHRWVIAHGVPSVAPDGAFEGFVGTCVDVTERRAAEVAVMESEARYRALVEASSTMVWSARPDGLLDDLPAWRAITGQSEPDAFGAGWADALHPDDRPHAEHAWREAVRAATPYEAEYRVRQAAGGYRWYQARGVPRLDADGRVREWVGTLTDTDERHRAEGALALLAGASRLLESSLDVAQTLESVARLTVPGHADYCVVHVVGEDGMLSHAAAHVDRAGEAALRTLGGRAPADPDGALGWTAAMRTGQPQLFPAVEGATYARDEEHRRLLAHVGTRSAIVLPLVARDAVLGALTLGTVDPDRRFDERDVAVAEQLAGRVALALDSARLFAAERAARGAAEDASRTKSEFLATMSHELRTPLNAVIGYTSLIVEGISGPVTDEQRRQLQRVQGSAQHLLALIEEILSLARLDAGRESVQLARLDLGALARETAAMVEPTIAAKGLRFAVDLPATPVVATTDPVKVRQILLNLLANAAKFTDRGEVAFALCVDDGRAVFEVRDSGIGIALEHQERIFEPFWQVEQSSTRRVGGTGLGLHVARRLARLLGGDVAVASTPGVGTAFAFWIGTDA